jgi:GTP-binding protein EngB required for normal cell division
LKLGNISKIRILDISNTGITESDLEKLPPNLEKIYCEGEKYKKIREELKNFAKKSDENGVYYDLQVREEAQSHVVQRTISLTSVESSSSNLSSSARNIFSASSPSSSVKSMLSSNPEISVTSSESIKERESYEEVNSGLNQVIGELQKQFEDLGKKYESEISNLKQEVTNLKSQVSEKEKIRNILLIGRTGSGKSTLANVLSNSDEFEESSRGASKTREKQVKEFTYRGIRYRIIDTPGIGDTKLKDEEILEKIMEVASYTREGINQIFFVVKGRFDDGARNTYKLISEFFVNEEGANDYITIVRTGFVNFKEERECEEDMKDMIDNCGEEVSKIIKKTYKRAKIIHVDNPPLDSKESQKIIESVKERKISRTVLLNYL